MNRSSPLAAFLDQAAGSDPDKIALIVPGREQVTYSRLNDLADRLCNRLRHIGVEQGDRVALHLHKSVAAVAAIYGILKSGAAYVPIDPEAPPSRARYILEDCKVKVFISDQPHTAIDLASSGGQALLLLLGGESSASSLDELLNSLESSDPSSAVGAQAVEPGDVAYILYTSGSTGRPKGVTLTHANALSFINWCSLTFDISSKDRISSHAPFHFDLSIFDIFIASKYGCTLVLMDEVLGKQPMRLAEAIATQEISVWYSTPSILVMLSTYGKLHLHDYSKLRLVLFAGEPLSVSKYLALRKFWGRAKCFNLYGPTETNVCTWYELPSDEVVRHMASIPIGNVCPPNLCTLIDETGERVVHGQGELLISGPNVMLGYWNQPEKNAAAFIIDGDNKRWYRTGDIVIQDAEFGLIYVGRRDRMVKRRGYRIELGDVEAGLLRLEDIQEAAVVSLPDEESGVRIVAFIAGRHLGRGSSAHKSQALSVLPRYMLPDEFVVVESVPKTSTDKTDYEQLKLAAVRA